MKRYRIGFTGTQDGMTVRQCTKLEAYLKNAEHVIEAFHHGDCVGADAQAHEIAVRILGADRVWIHPPSNPKKRAFCKSPHILPTQDYLDRNHEIVDVTAGLIVCPKTKTEQLRSGTWATWRYAKKRNKPFTILEP